MKSFSGNLHRPPLNLMWLVKPAWQWALAWISGSAPMINNNSKSDLQWDTWFKSRPAKGHNYPLLKRLLPSPHTHSCLRFHIHTDTHRNPQKLHFGLSQDRAKLMTSRCCHWWTSQHVVVYSRSAPNNTPLETPAPSPPSCQTHFGK